MIKFEDLSDYDKGIFWGLGSFVGNDDRFVFRHNERHFLDRMKCYVSSNIYSQEFKGKVQYVLKTREVDINSFIEHGWTERNSDQRNVPVLDDYRDFMRGYIELHSTIKYSRRYGRRDKSIRYRAVKLIIYGNLIMMESINKILHEAAGVGNKKVQVIAPNGKTSSLDFASFDEITRILDYVYDNPNCENFWNTVNEKMNNPIIFD